MNLTQLLFYCFAAVVIGSAIFVVTTKNIIYAAFALFSTFFGVAALYVYARADFIAVAQLIVYVGGILVLLIFGVMLTNKVSGQKIQTQERNKIAGFIISLAIFLILLVTIQKANFSGISWINEIKLKGQELDPSTSTIHAIGIKTMTDYIIPFEITGVLLMMALLGAAYMARRDSGTEKKSD
ncbi:MAG: hypothetical protein A3H98_06790 [Bacteroidetes bacterium RIFCSPLOWO2_02_FULL_36_8]|nr:MAG: hypothetical protein A3H98_06790 [Bacteroidetes bacterium RIFCSPLOWO2_02_FULL_36_8]OFY71168.1 MAG: hypothetical protein A3G23_15300 [Bacteroidetes bacterium RIFCSPLOWO2_12_FULL_37_12]